MSFGPDCVRLDDAIRDRGHADVGLRKWTMPLIHAIADEHEPARFSILLNALKVLTPRALSDGLKRMEGAGLVKREVTEGFPPSTRYTLTPLGRRYVPVIGRLAKLIE